MRSVFAERASEEDHGVSTSVQRQLRRPEPTNAFGRRRRSLAGDRQIERIVRLAGGLMIDDELRFFRVDVGVVVEILESVGSEEAHPRIVAVAGQRASRICQAEAVAIRTTHPA